MAALYQEIFVGATAYPTGPQMTTIPASVSGPANPLGYHLGWKPEFHTYRVVAGSSGADVMWSYDGKNDHGRAPVGPDSAGGLILPQHMPVFYQQVWLRSTIGVTAQVGVGFYTKQ